MADTTVDAGLLALGGEEISGLPDIATLDEGDMIVVLVGELSQADESKEQWAKVEVTTASGQVFALAGHAALMRALGKVQEDQWCLIQCLGRPSGKQWIDYQVHHLTKADPASPKDVMEHLPGLAAETDAVLEARSGS